MVGLTSAAGLVGFLQEPDAELRTFALQAINQDIDLLWPEVSEHISQIEALYEDESFADRSLAALVASKVYYQLQEYNESMIFALSAGKLFNINSPGEYEDTIISKCVDAYIALSSAKSASQSATAINGGTQPSQLMTSFPAHADGAASSSATLTSPTTPFSHSALPSKSLLSRQNSIAVDATSPILESGAFGSSLDTAVTRSNMSSKLEAVIRRLFESCFEVGAYHQVVGIAIEAHNLDVLREAILKSSQGRTSGKGKVAAAQGQGEDILEYVLDICMNVVQERDLRNEV